MNLLDMTIKKASSSLNQKEISVKELAETAFDTIRNKKEINAFITLTEDVSFAQRKKAQKLIDVGKAMSLTGIPFGIKDNILTRGIKTTAASKMLAEFVPPYDATITEKLFTNGAVIIGKTNLDEFAMGSATNTSFFGATLNPHDITKIPGGSSGGSAAAVASGMILGAVGTDTGGSIVQPAAFCGVAGLKPTYGRVSRHGLIAFANSLDQIGPIGKTANDCGMILEAISGYDVQDNTSFKEQYKFERVDTSKITIGIIRNLENFDWEEDVKSNFETVVNFYKNKGFNVKYIDIPSLDYSVAAYYIISSCEATTNLARFDGVKYGYSAHAGNDYKEVTSATRSHAFGIEVKKRIILGNYWSSESEIKNYYLRALEEREELKKDIHRIFEDVDVIISPTTLETAYDENSCTKGAKKLYSSAVTTVFSNLSGIPTLSINTGVDKNNMPIGTSFSGKWMNENLIISLATLFEQELREI